MYNVLCIVFISVSFTIEMSLEVFYPEIEVSFKFQLTMCPLMCHLMCPLMCPLMCLQTI